MCLCQPRGCIVFNADALAAIDADVVIKQENVDVFNADALAADKVDVLTADDADVLAADTTVVLSTDCKQALTPRAIEMCLMYLCKQEATAQNIDLLDFLKGFILRFSWFLSDQILRMSSDFGWPGIHFMIILSILGAWEPFLEAWGTILAQGSDFCDFEDVSAAKG